MILMIKLLRYIKRKFIMIKILRQNKEYLKKGKYKFDETMTYLYLESDPKSDIIRDMLSSDYKVISYKNNFVKSIINLFIKIITTPLTRVNNTKDSQGIVLLISTSSKNIKIFDLDNMHVITRFRLRCDYEQEVNNYYLFKDHFNIPEIYETKSESLTIVQRLLRHKPTYETSPKELNYIRKVTFDLIYEFQSSVIDDIKEINLLNLYKKYNGNVGENNLLSLIGVKKKTLDTSIPTNIVHGDLTPSNILYYENTNEVFIIDFETAHHNVFFYDIFYLMFIEVESRSNYDLIEGLISNKYYHYFKELFQLYQLVYDDFDYITLFKMFFISYCITRNFQGETLNIKIETFNKIMGFIDKKDV